MRLPHVVSVEFTSSPWWTAGVCQGRAWQAESSAGPHSSSACASLLAQVCCPAHPIPLTANRCGDLPKSRLAVSCIPDWVFFSFFQVYAPPHLHPASTDQAAQQTTCRAEPYTMSTASHTQLDEHHASEGRATGREGPGPESPCASNGLAPDPPQQQPSVQDLSSSAFQPGACRRPSEPDKLSARSDESAEDHRADYHGCRMIPSGPTISLPATPEELLALPISPQVHSIGSNRQLARPPDGLHEQNGQFTLGARQSED